MRARDTCKSQLISELNELTVLDVALQYTVLNCEVISFHQI